MCSAAACLSLLCQGGVVWCFSCIQIVLFVAFVWSALVVWGDYSCVCYEGGEGVIFFVFNFLPWKMMLPTMVAFCYWGEGVP